MTFVRLSYLMFETEDDPPRVATAYTTLGAYSRPVSSCLRDCEAPDDRALHTLNVRCFARFSRACVRKMHTTRRWDAAKIWGTVIIQ